MQISSWARRDLRDFQRVALSGLSGKTLQAAVPTTLFASSDIKKKMPKLCSLRQWNSESENSIITDTHGARQYHSLYAFDMLFLLFVYCSVIFIDMRLYI